MLVLSRKNGEKIIYSLSPETVKMLAEHGEGCRITLTVVQLRSDKVRIGSVAPDHVRIDREEVFELRKLAELADVEMQACDLNSRLSDAYEAAAKGVESHTEAPLPRSSPLEGMW